MIVSSKLPITLMLKNVTNEFGQKCQNSLSEGLLVRQKVTKMSNLMKGIYENATKKCK